MSKFHINKKGLPGVCKATKGNCPFGGAESHYDSAEEAQASANRENESNFGLLPKETGSKEYSGPRNTSDKNNFYQGKTYFETEYSINKNSQEAILNSKTLNRDGIINPENAGQILNESLKEDGAYASYKGLDFSDNETEMVVEINKIRENEFEAKGEIKVYSMIEEDFEDENKYQEYLNDGPDQASPFKYRFTSEDLKEHMEDSGYTEHKSNATGAIMASIYEMSENHLE